MPDWQPDWSDVAFDHAAADEAAHRCRATAEQIATGMPAVGRSRGDALVDWRGRSAVQYASLSGGVRDDLRVLRDDLLALARTIDAAGESARTEQARREAARDRWRAQRHAELTAAHAHRLGLPVRG